jgi:hypothetical protein
MSTASFRIERDRIERDRDSILRVAYLVLLAHRCANSLIKLRFIAISRIHLRGNVPPKLCFNYPFSRTRILKRRLTQILGSPNLDFV